MKRKQLSILLFFISLGIIIFIGLNSTRFFFRADLTETNMFTLSDTSKELYREIPDTVTITYYLSERLKQRIPEASQVEDLLREFAAYSRGSIEVKVVDPAAENLQSRAEQLGVVPQPMQTVQQNEVSQTMVYSGIVIQYLDRYKTLPFVFSLNTLEYEVTSAIRRLVNNEELVVGLLSGDSERNTEYGYRLISGRLNQTFTFRQLQLGQPVPEEVDVLLVLGARNIREHDLLPIDQFIMRGGNVFFGAEHVFVNVNRGLTPQPLSGNPVFSMLEEYGVRIKPNIVLDQEALEFPVQQNVGGYGVTNYVDYPHWISILPKNTSSENPVTARFAGLDLLWASSLEVEPPEGVESQVLARTSGMSWMMSEDFNINPNEVMRYTNPVRGEGEHVVAAGLWGEFSSYFADREVPSQLPGSASGEVIKKSPGSRIIVVGDSDFASDLVQFTNSPYNFEFIENACQWLSSDEDLLSIKTRASRDTRLNAVESQEKQARIMGLSQIVNVILIPVLVVGYAVWRNTRRKRKAHKEVDHAD
ncbi:MAG: GldG family protein [Spirochaetales bacterium]|nr:GldG family protein [Spirochaetales bacterium]MCF7938210.1 GldG family protein [Spirochaetales bacterium]